MKPHLRISVARRLALLAIAESVTITVLAAIILLSVQRVGEYVAFTRRYGLPPIDAIGKVLVQNGHILDTARHQLSLGEDLDPAIAEEHVRVLRALESRYRFEWLIAGNSTPDAVKGRRVLEPAGRTDLIDDEKAAFDEFIGALRSVDDARKLELPIRTNETVSALTDTQSALRQLRNVSIDQVAVWQAAVQQEIDGVRRLVLIVAVLGIVVATWAALHVRRAIAPRIHQLVRKVRRFAEIGVNERVFDSGQDEIGVLANALDAGFNAIMNRDRDRERFLAVVAHELKTPLSSILGFAQAANLRPGDEKFGRRALELVERHGLRLNQLLEHVLLAARARIGDLTLHRAPTDLAADVCKVVLEVEASGSGRPISVQGLAGAPILADEQLLLHALWVLLTYAVAITPLGKSVSVSIVHEPPRSEVRVDVDGRDLSDAEFAHALAPFGALVYEGVGGARTGIGLFLCREIARVHGGALRMERMPTGLRLVLELPS